MHTAAQETPITPIRNGRHTLSACIGLPLSKNTYLIMYSLYDNIDHGNAETPNPKAHKTDRWVKYFYDLPRMAVSMTCLKENTDVYGHFLISLYSNNMAHWARHSSLAGLKQSRSCELWIPFYLHVRHKWVRWGASSDNIRKQALRRPIKSINPPDLIDLYN